MEEVEVQHAGESIESSEIHECDGQSNGAADQQPLQPNGINRRSSGPARRSSKWTKEEDDILRDAVQRYKGKCWKKIAECLPGRTDVQCLHRWQKVLNPNLVKGLWSKEEDDLLIQLVQDKGLQKWSEIAKDIPTRSGKQCRERWFNHLTPNISKAAWTKEEESVLVTAHAEHGNKWCEIAKRLPGRSENSVKNHWNCSLKKRVDSAKGESCLPGWIHRFLGGFARYMPTTIRPPNGPPNNLVIDETQSSEYLQPHLSSPGANRYECRNSPVSCSVRLTRNHHTCNNPATHHGPSDNPYFPGLCYEPPEMPVPNISQSTGTPLDTSKSVTRPVKASSDSCISLISSHLRRAAATYDNVPSIITKHATQDSREVIHATEYKVLEFDDDDRLRTKSENVILSPKYKKVEVIKSVGRCLEQEFSGALMNSDDTQHQELGG